MATPANTFGLLLLVIMSRFLPVHAPASLGTTLLEIMFPLLWVRTISVRQASMVIPCGMDRDVVPLAPVVPSTHHHGSMYDYPPPQLITLRSGSVVFWGTDTQILQYSSLSSM